MHLYKITIKNIDLWEIRLGFKYNEQRTILNRFVPIDMLIARDLDYNWPSERIWIEILNETIAIAMVAWRLGDLYTSLKMEEKKNYQHKHDNAPWLR